MYIIGLTGSIAMGKSTVASIFAQHGVPVFDADRAVHDLYNTKETYEWVEQYFPTAIMNDQIDRSILRQKVFKNPSDKSLLEQYMHPRVRQAEYDFMRAHKRLGVKVVLLDIPLLFETGGDKRCDLTLCVLAPKHVQQFRLKKRGVKNAQKIIKAQMNDRDKIHKADKVVHTGLGLPHTMKQVKDILSCVK